ncbi:Ig-like domain-containing protein [[Clostridium] polysaccharolyticum]|uniref:Ig-like domain (Group 2) n=1 Tax=[Clostridium] polysaccharolyticum TaxID=29364 RepID=A0A1I0F870_9FIRM|nr:Ig-like domain-containing protein [[Clostridium] polysaccharolyticum]SET53471.1 Ig-like domain (group 2) [[Clostridium] polysaccharolyticum]
MERLKNTNLMKKMYTGLLLAVMVLQVSLGGVPVISTTTLQAETTVYITRTGSKYHTHKCGNGTYFPASLSEAKSYGLTPCKKCFPNGGPSSSSSGKSKPASTGAASHRVVKEHIVINKTQKTLLTGEHFQLKASGTSKSVAWSSNNRNVAKVTSKGKVIAAGKGRTTITAKAGGTQKTCKIIVESPVLSEKSVVLEPNQSQTIKLQGCSFPVRWKSSDNSVVCVKNGKLTAKSVGTARVTAIVHNKEYICKVSVRKPQIKWIELEAEEIELSLDESCSLSFVTEPYNAGDYYDIKCVTSNANVVTAQADGHNAIYIEAQGKEGSATVQVIMGNKRTKCKVYTKKEN